MDIPQSIALVNYMISKMSLLAGTPINTGKYLLKPWTLKEINEFGIEAYSIFTNYLLITTDKLKDQEGINSSALVGASNYDAFCALLLVEGYTRDIVLKGIENTLGMESFLDQDKGLFFLNSNNEYEVFDDDYFEIIQRVFSMQNYLSDEDDDRFKPANKKASELHEKLMRARRKVRESRKNEKDGLQLHDIISIVACYSDGVNLNTIWDYTIYQLYEEYARLLLWDEVHTLRDMLPHIDDNSRKSMKMKHWGSKVSPKTFKEEE